jgi:hypothetical protein
MMCLSEPAPGLLGVCVLDAATGRCWLGGAAEAAGRRAALNMLLLRFRPAEVGEGQLGVYLSCNDRHAQAVC